MNPLVDWDDDTVKRCPPFVESMTYGFLIPLVCDVRCEDEELSWDQGVPPCGAMEFPRSPLGFHHPAQVTGTPLCDEHRFLISSTASGPSRRRRATRCCSCIRPIASTCLSPR